MFRATPKRMTRKTKQRFVAIETIAELGFQANPLYYFVSFFFFKFNSQMKQRAGIIILN